MKFPNFDDVDLAICSICVIVGIALVTGNYTEALAGMGIAAIGSLAKGKTKPAPKEEPPTEETSA